MTAYYNEIDSFAADWLRNLIKAGLIAPGDVDERSIEDVAPIDLEPYTQCHFFAGIGGWSYALRLAGWPDDWPVWTGSCPCQPFSAAGKGEGFADERHLWPSWFWLIRQSRPSVVFGEQVASKLGLSWFDIVSADLEGQDYRVGAVDLCAASIGAPHERQRLWFVADAEGRRQAGVHGRNSQIRSKKAYRDVCEFGNWQLCSWLPFRDKKARQVEPESFPLAHGLPKNMGQYESKSEKLGNMAIHLERAKQNLAGRIRGYGNAIVPQVGAEFIRAYMEK